MKKNNTAAIIMIVVLSLLIVLIVAFLVKFINTDFKITSFRFNISSVSNKLQFSKTYSESFEKINVNGDAIDIYIKDSNDANTYLKIYSSKKKYKVDTINNELYINEYSKNNINFFNFKVSKLELYVPKDYNKNINIDTKYGDIRIENFNDAKFDVKSKAGDIKVNSAKELNLSNNFGDIKVVNSKVLKAQNSAGDIKISRVDSAQIKNSAGDIKINLINKYINIKNSAGDIDINNLNVAKNSKIINKCGDIKINNVNDVFIDAKTEVGDLDYNNKRTNSTLTLIVKNKLGDIEINN